MSNAGAQDDGFGTSGDPARAVERLALEILLSLREKADVPRLSIKDGDLTGSSLMNAVTGHTWNTRHDAMCIAGDRVRRIASTRMRQRESHRYDDMDTPAADDASGQRPSAFSAFVDEMLARHGIAERQRTRAIEHALGLSYNQARRLMTGKAPWSLEQLRRVAEHFNEPVVPLVAAHLHQPGKPASFRVGASDLPCTIWPTGEPVAGRVGPLVALHDPGSGRWTVAPAVEVANRPAYALSALLFERRAPRRVAVLDDELDSARAVADFLRAKDLDVQAFASGSELLGAMQSLHFDGYVVDWILGTVTAADVLASIRAVQPTAPVIILTGQLRTGAAREDDLGAAAATYRALVLEKPTRMLSILNALQLGFDAPPSEA